MHFFRNKFPNTRQLESKDCGPACLQIIAKYYNRFFELDYLRDICGIKKNGISIYDFIKASETIGLQSQAYKLSYWKFRNEIPLPCVVHWKGNHFMVVYKITARYIYVSDPQNGLSRYTLRQFADGWLTNRYIEHGKEKRRGTCIVPRPTDDFMNENGQTRLNGAKPTIMSTLKYVYSYLGLYKHMIIRIMMLMIGITMLNMLFPIITQSIIDVGIPSKDHEFITLMLISSLILTVSVSLSRWLQQFMTTHLSVQIKLAMQSDFIGKMFRLPITFFETRLMGDIKQRSIDYDRLESFIMTSSFGFILSLLQITVFGGILYYYNSTILWVFLAGGVVYCSWIIFFWNIRKRMDIKYFSFQAQNESQWFEMLSNMTDIKSFKYSVFKRWQWEKIQIKLFKTRIKLLNVDQLQNLGSSLIDASKNMVLIYLGAIYVTNGDMSIGMLIAIQYIVGQLSAPLESVIQFIVSIQLANISYLRVKEILDKPEEDRAPMKSFKPELVDYSKHIILKNVYFKYSINEDYILKNINCIFPKGKMIAIAGESGCGKSTIIKLMAGLYTPASGSICIGDIHLSSIPISEWRSKIGLLSQDSGLLNETILENILFGREYDSLKLQKAVELANIKSDIEKKPMAYETMIQENGKGVSEGQKQRMLFARAIYDSPQFLLLDELTSTLDSSNEISIIETIKQLPYHPTTLIVAHRLSSVKQADMIVVLKDGAVAEIGTHSTLFAKNGIYYNLFKAQDFGNQ